MTGSFMIDKDDPVRVETLEPTPGRPFLRLRLGPYSFLPYGFADENARFARELGAQLLEAATELETRSRAKEAVPPNEEATP